jgi:hypothetical protein
MKPEGMKYLQLYESWCLFAYREFYKNLLAILVELSLGTYVEKTKNPNSLCKHFCLHNDERIQEYLTKLSNRNNSVLGFSYGTVMNSQRYIICLENTQPRQFLLEKIPTMSAITDSMGEGWDT